MTHIVLIHGICHGAWCWYKVVPLLKSAGHRVTPLDLGACGINPRQITELDSVPDFVQPLMELMAYSPQEEKVILVGHSFGGISISLAMESFPTKVLAAVYVTAFMPNYHFPIATAVAECMKRVSAEPVMDFEHTFDDGVENPPTRAFFGPKFMETKDIELILTLQRQGKWFIKDLSKESLLTKEKFGSIDRVYIVCQDDLLIKESLQKWYIENSPTIDVKSIAGADPSPLSSATVCNKLLPNTFDSTTNVSLSQLCNQ